MATPFQVVANIVTGTTTLRQYTVVNPTRAGDTLTAIAVVNNTSCTISAMTDSQGNNWILDASFTSAAPMVYAYHCVNAAHALSTSDTFNLTTPAVAGNVEFYVTDMGPTGALDNTPAIATGTGTTPSVSATPTVNNDIASSMFGTQNGGGAPTVNSPFTSLGSFSTGSNPFSVGAYHQISGGSGVAQTSTLTIVSAGWRGVMWIFKPGTTTESGPFNITLPAPVTSLAGSVQHTESGPFSLTLPAPVMSLAGSVMGVESGPFNITLPAPVTSLAAVVQGTESGPFSLTLPAPVMSLAGTVVNPSGVAPPADTGGLTVGGLAGRPGRGHRQRFRRANRRLI